MEESMVDTATIFASFLDHQLAGETIKVDQLRDILRGAQAELRRAEAAAADHDADVAAVPHGGNGHLLGSLEVEVAELVRRQDNEAGRGHPVGDPDRQAERRNRAADAALNVASPANPAADRKDYPDLGERPGHPGLPVGAERGVN